MTTLVFNQESITLEEGETVLDALLRNQHSIPYGCRAGACQSCLMRTTETDIAKLPVDAQAGLKPSQKSLGYFLSCRCKPSKDLNVALVDQTRERFKAKVIDKTLLNEHTLRLRLETQMPFVAGQYLNIWLDPSTIRSYSIASTPAEGVIELHIKIIPGGKFSPWARNHLKQGDTLTVQGPLGHCIYTPTFTSSPLLLVGIGTGLAPLYGIIKDALMQQHQGPINLVLGARKSSQFYLQDELAELALQHKNLNIQLIAQTNDATTHPKIHISEGSLYSAISNAHKNTKDYQIFLCGAESFVNKMKKQCFLGGAAMSHIHTDVFLPCA